MPLRKPSQRSAKVTKMSSGLTYENVVEAGKWDEKKEALERVNRFVWHCLNYLYTYATAKPTAPVVKHLAQSPDFFKKIDKFEAGEDLHQKILQEYSGATTTDVLGNILEERKKTLADGEYRTARMYINEMTDPKKAAQERASRQAALQKKLHELELKQSGIRQLTFRMNSFPDATTLINFLLDMYSECLTPSAVNGKDSISDGEECYDFFTRRYLFNKLFIETLEPATGNIKADIWEAPDENGNVSFTDFFSDSTFFGLDWYDLLNDMYYIHAKSTMLSRSILGMKHKLKPANTKSSAYFAETFEIITIIACKVVIERIGKNSALPDLKNIVNKNYMSEVVIARIKGLHAKYPTFIKWDYTNLINNRSKNSLEFMRETCPGFFAEMETE